MEKLLLRVLGALCIIWLLMGCQGDSAESGIPQVTFVGKEYSYEGPDTIESGWTELTLDNQGEMAHDLLLIKLGDGRTAEDILPALESDGIPPWVSFYGGVSAEAGTQASYTIEIPAGDYAIMSFGSNEEGPPDAFQGMLKGLTVTQGDQALSAEEMPSYTASIDLIDYNFEDQGLKSGPQMVRIANAGEEQHELIVYRLNDGYTFADFQSYMDEAMESEGGPVGESPVEDVTGVFLSPGVAEYLEMDLDPGNYVFICHFPSEKNGMMPHFALGMMKEVVVP